MVESMVKRHVVEWRRNGVEVKDHRGAAVIATMHLVALCLGKQSATSFWDIRAGLQGRNADVSSVFSSKSPVHPKRRALGI